MIDMKPERKLKYLSEYISQLVDRRVEDAIDLSDTLFLVKEFGILVHRRQKAEFKQPFDRWLESTIDKKKSKGEKKSTETLKRYCSYCGRPYDEYYIEKTRDHIVPVSRGGKNVKENRVHACRECNEWKSDKQLEDWYKELRHLVRKGRIKPPYDERLVGRMIGNIKRIMENVKQNAKRISNYKF